MEIFYALLAVCAGNSPVSGEISSHMPVTRSFGSFFDLRLHKQLSKHLRRQWLETPSLSLWRQRNAGKDMGLNKRQVNTWTNDKSGPVLYDWVGSWPMR